MLISFAAGCQPLPRPFADDENGRLLAFPEGYGVVVGEITGLPPELADELRAATVTALQRAGLLASTGRGNRRSYLLTAEAGPPRGELPSDPDGIDLEWRLQDADGVVLETVAGAVRLRSDQVGAGTAPLLDLLARRVAEGISAGTPMQDIAGRAASQRLPVSVVPVEGAPGDGREALARALRSALRAHGLQVASSGIDADGVLVYGDVRIRPAEDGQEKVTLEWAVRWPDGREVGTVSQSNVIPAGLLTDAWGPVADAAAEGAASGIAPLIEEVAAQQER